MQLKTVWFSLRNIADHRDYQIVATIPPASDHYFPDIAAYVISIFGPACLISCKTIIVEINSPYQSYTGKEAISIDREENLSPKNETGIPFSINDLHRKKPFSCFPKAPGTIILLFIGSLSSEQIFSYQLNFPDRIIRINKTKTGTASTSRKYKSYVDVDLSRSTNCKLKIRSCKGNYSASGAYSTFLLPAISFLSRRTLSPVFFIDKKETETFAMVFIQYVYDASYAPSGWLSHRYLLLLVNHLKR
ncbi:MAG: hypothetical protein V9F01_09120 [Chitinophagaceae bacterium]